MIKYPDYDNSILSVISSILKYYGYDNGHKSLELLDKKLEKKYLVIKNNRILLKKIT